MISSLPSFVRPGKMLAIREIRTAIKWLAFLGGSLDQLSLMTGRTGLTRTGLRLVDGLLLAGNPLVIREGLLTAGIG